MLKAFSYELERIEINEKSVIKHKSETLELQETIENLPENKRLAAYIFEMVESRPDIFWLEEMLKPENWAKPSHKNYLDAANRVLKEFSFDEAKKFIELIQAREN